MRTTLLRLALLGTMASLPAFAQTTTAPAGRAPDQPRNDSVRPVLPNQGVAAGQGTPNTTGTTMPHNNTAAGTTTPHNNTAAGTATPRNDTVTGTTTPNRSDSGGNNAVQLDSGTRMGSLEHGANSFTEGQARDRIAAAGFTNIQGLRKDDNGIWRGRAMHGGQQVDVGLDYRGNVSPLTR